ncbi:hypothetical protein RFI_33242, partial [Reticulomyxa filosa]
KESTADENTSLLNQLQMELDKNEQVAAKQKQIEQHNQMLQGQNIELRIQVNSMQELLLLGNEDLSKRKEKEASFLKELLSTNRSLQDQITTYEQMLRQIEDTQHQQYYQHLYEAAQNKIADLEAKLQANEQQQQSQQHYLHLHQHPPLPPLPSPAQSAISL